MDSNKVFPVREAEAEAEKSGSSMEPAVSTPPDGGYGWVIVAASAVVHLLVLGNIYSFGILFPVYIDEFNAPQGSVAWVGSISAGLMTGLGAYTGVWADRYGNARMLALGAAIIFVGFFLASYSTALWHLYLTQGVICGIGHSLAFVSAISVVGQWFTIKRGLAMGIAAAGSGVGQSVLSIITEELLVRFKWRTTLRYLAIIDFAGLLACSLVVRRFIPCIQHKSSESGLIYFRDRNFIFLYLSGVISTLGLFMPFTHLMKYILLHGVARGDAIMILMIMGISSAVGRIAIGFGSDLIGKISMLVVCMGVGGASTLAWMGCTDFPTLMLYGVVYGFFAGGVISLLPTVAAELYGIQRIGTVIGVLYTGTATGNFLAAPIGGFLFDATHDYYWSISLAGGLMLVGTVFAMMIDPSRKFEILENTSNNKPLSAAAVGDGDGDDGIVEGFTKVEEGQVVELRTVKKR